jgi:diguanylate cyclase (GGDEF)-like protein/PAS domain S-box-containing protein
VGDSDTAALLLTCATAADTPLCIADATVPDQPLLYVNPAFETLTGYPAHHVLGRNCRFLQGPDTDPAAVRALGDGIRSGTSVGCRLVNYRADGSPFWNEVRISAVRDPEGRVTHFLATQRDVTSDVEARADELRAASRDPLTALPSRVHFVTEVDRELARATRHGGAFAVLLLDVDDFKSVNDRHGHLVGDGHLIHVAECLRGRLRGQDVAARLGGDEFVALLVGLARETAADAVTHVVADLQRVLAEPFTVDGVVYRTTVTIGSAVYPDHGSTARELMRRADVDMYGRKPPRREAGAPVRS